MHRLIAAALISGLVASMTSVLADPPAAADLQEFKLDDALTVRLPAGFKVRKGPEKRPSFLALGPSPEDNGKKRPAVILFPSSPVKEADREAFLAAAKRAASNTMTQFGLRVKETADLPPQNGIAGANMIAENGQGPSWWGVRTIHAEHHSLQVVIGTFDKETFDRLAELTSTESFIAK